MKKLLIISQLILCCLTFQKVKAQGPAVQWSISDWTTKYYDGTTNITQNQSGEDWWYCVKNYRSGGVQTGYVVCGYAEYNVSSNSSDPFYWQTLANNYATPVCDNYTEPISGGGFDPAQINCGEFETVTNKKGLSIGQIALKDLNGNTIWEKSYNLGGDLTNVIQVSDGFIAIGTAVNEKSLSVSGHPSIAYNPTGGTPVYFTNCPNNIGHAYVVKTDFNGVVQWEYTYGYATSNGTGNSTDPAYINGTGGNNIIQASNGHLIITGSGTNISAGSATGCDIRGFVLDLDANGLVQNKYFAPLYPIPSSQNTHALTPFFNEFLGITEIGSTGKYAVVGRQFNLASGNCVSGIVFPSVEYTKGIVVCLDNNLTLDPTWSANNNPVFFTGTGTSNTSLYTQPNTFASNIWNVTYHSAGNQILIPLVSDCSNCNYTGAEGTCYLYRLNPTNGLLMTGINPSLMGYAKAFDLRPDVREDLDGGIIYSSTTKRSSMPVTPADLGSFYNCITNNGTSTDYAYYYDTDAYIAKFDVNGVKMWEKFFDRQPVGAPRVPYPGDVKKKECIFKLDVSDDGGYVLAGTSSQNMEDDYLVKLKDNCDPNSYTYDITGAGNIINITSNTTWSSSHKVLGSVHVKAPYTLSISGPNTVIEFADSRVSGITTNIYVENGASLNIGTGAKLTSIQGCTTFMWDGVILQGQTTQLSQTTTNQPQAYLNVGTIENARTAFLVGDNTTNPYNGAILKATSVTFHNNDIDAQFSPYTAPLVGGSEPNNISYFDNCVFLGDAYLNDAVTYGIATTDKHIWFNQTKGIFVKGCAFKTDASLMGSSYGIYSTDATFTVIRRCNIYNTITGACGGNPSSFTNLQYGIYAQSTNNTKNFTVDQNTFTNCSGSIYESGINYSTVTSNTFVINTAVPPITSHLCTINHNCVAWFHYINNCNGFTHQQNIHTVTGTTQHIMGTIFNGTSSSASSTYRNTYSGLYQSHLAQGGNANLQIQCNQSTGTTFADISVTSGAMPSTQGSCLNAQSAANNTFSRPNFSSTSDVNSVATAFTYFYNNSPSTGNQVPSFRTSNISLNSCGLLGTFNYATACPSLLGGGGQGGGSNRIENNNTSLLVTPSISGSNLRQSKDEIAYNARQAQYALDQAITNLLNDTIKPNRDSLLIVLLKTDTTEKGKTDLVHAYLGRKDYVNAQIYINQVKNLPGCAKKGIFLQHCKDLKQQNKTWQDINTNASLRSDLIGFAYDSLSNGFGNARCVLAMVKKAHNYEYVEAASESAAAANSRLANTDNTENLHIILDANKIVLNAYPNPFNDELTVNVTLPENTVDAKLQLIEPATGRVLMEKTLADKQQDVVFDTKQLSSGLYLIGIKSANNKAQFIKVTTFK